MTGTFFGNTDALRERYGKITPEILREIQEAAGAKNVVAGDPDALESYASDEAGIMFTSMPDAVVKAEGAEQVAAVMKVASKHRIPVTPRGAGSGLAGAAVPLCGGIVLSLEKMNRILEIDPVNRVAVVEPGVVTNELCKAVAEEGFLYAGYPMSTETSFIGGNVATNAGGGKVIRYGNTRRHVLGLEVVLPTGTVLNLGGRIRKDTWGYSLMQLMVGSEGTLGIITKVIVNLEPKPGKTVNLLVAFPDLDTAVDSVAKVVRTGISVISCELMDKLSVNIAASHVNTVLPYQDRADAFLLIQIEGDTDERLEEGYEKVGTLCLENGALEVFVAESRTESGMVWNIRQNLAEAMRAHDPYCSLSGDMVVPLSAVPEMVEEIRRAGKERGITVGILGHIADGNLHPIIFKPADMEPMEWAEYAEAFYDDLTSVAVRLGGVGSGEHGIGYVKMPIFLHSKPAEEIEIMRGIKRSFDPDGILNPGKLLGS
ncbi:FAD-binding oxidoreductase [Aminivibrio sp.]|jgi:glycolate oxidase|uniref:FAD-binding oxidoreductase n=1 Tax=Aminivibrio sp. TaxID=1872489 RepID=UPI001A4FAA75|nr:FAD-binding oxidoreductase [Aminivibrio sp.]MBL3540301.1 FAD-binding oxidoreductase [Aminivibrio sp.]MDK2959360.1 glycolate oxidase [Synergistaceae bacterium]